MHDVESLAREVVNASVRIHMKLGPGLDERIYCRILARDLDRRGLFVEEQKPISFEFEGMWFDNAFFVDVMVERKLIIEVKSVISLTPTHIKQVVTYLRLTELPLGILANFGAALMKEGIRRVLNTAEPWRSKPG